MAIDTSSLPQFTILGGGLAGSLMAIYLRRAGYTVTIYEKRLDPRCGVPEAGRSINLALSTRGIVALRELGLLDEIMRQAIPMKGRMLHDLRGNVTFQSYGSSADEVLYSVSRLGLNIALLDFAEQREAVPICFGMRCHGVNFDDSTINLSTAGTKASSPIPFNLLIGADGAFSAVRTQMQYHDRFSYQQNYIEHGYKELTIPALSNGRFALDQKALHIWPRGTYMMIALPNNDGSFTCTLFWPFHGPHSFEALTTAAEIKQFFSTTFPDAISIMPTLVEDFIKNPVSSLVTIRCNPWHYHDKAVLIGDACHAVLPFYGQGMNAAFEDCTVLSRSIKQHAPDFHAAFVDYQRQRKQPVDTLADLAYDNFIEMRDKVNSPLFLAWKQLENALHSAFPKVFVSLHGIVSFSTTPYDLAVQRVRRQNYALGIVVFFLALLLLRFVW